jgi:hypothetical protein
VLENGSRASALARWWEAVLSAFRSYAESLFTRDPSAPRPPNEETMPMRYTGEADLPAISDEEFTAVRGSLRRYTIVILKTGPRFEPPDPGFTSDVGRIILAHGRRNASLRRAGLMPIVCPVSDDSDVAGVSILDADREEADRIMSNDPGVLADVFTYELHEARGIPGSALPGEATA